MKDINEMTRADFEALPQVNEDYVTVGGVVFLPTRKIHETGFRNFICVLIDEHHTPIGKCPAYDVFDFANTKYITFDCLKKSGLMRAWFRKPCVCDVNYVQVKGISKGE